MYLLWAGPGLRGGTGAFSGCGKGRRSLVAGCGLLAAGASLAAARGHRSQVAVRRLLVAGASLAVQH